MTVPEKPDWYGLYSRIFVPHDQVQEALTLTWPDLCWRAQCQGWTHAGSLEVICPEGYVAIKRTNGVEIVA